MALLTFKLHVLPCTHMHTLDCNGPWGTIDPYFFSEGQVPGVVV